MLLDKLPSSITHPPPFLFPFLSASSCFSLLLLSSMWHIDPTDPRESELRQRTNTKKIEEGRAFVFFTLQPKPPLLFSPISSFLTTTIFSYDSTPPFPSGVVPTTHTSPAWAISRPRKGGSDEGVRFFLLPTRRHTGRTGVEKKGGRGHAEADCPGRERQER
ncbi:hypothetical protein F5X68DRAFT_73796 [Plectosphaerella plurivora]|uniref:Uncharacterized protein n=1 Tax=Plectosphaerella plurivora TaxID=936078 RepID=A0A9P8VF01_9PEZI|nr:hypothetical protein F5X68DRAFT_73796 [Plectosphaerella plurivora]